MTTTQRHRDSATLVLTALTAADLMTPNVVSIRHDATVHEAAACLLQHEISAAPVIDAAGRAIGVISHTDIVRNDSRPGTSPADEAAYYRDVDPRCPPGLREFIHGKFAQSRPVREVMSPVVIQHPATDSALSVIANLLALKIHRLFVADEAGTLIGVISTFDVLRALKRAI